MSRERTSLPASDEPSNPPDGDTLNDGRRYWKAAIAHLAPEKREAAWEFYIDRLESSAAADTLGGVMLLLEAHLAFFDDLPARLGSAAQRIEAAARPLDRAGALPASSSPLGASDRGNSASSGRTRRFSLFPVCLAAMLGGILGGAGTIAYQCSRSAAAPADHSTAARAAFPLPSRSLVIESWNDPATGHRKGSIVCFSRVATTERTAEGGAKVYVLMPVEEVRENLRALQQLSQ